MSIGKKIITLFFAGLILWGCTPSEQVSSSMEDSELKVYTTIYPFQYAVEQIGGDTVSVETVYPPGVDAHTYEPTSKDMTAIAKGDAFIYLGAGMEGFAQSAAAALASQKVKLIEIGKHEELFREGHGEEAHDHDDHEEDTHGEEAHDHGDHEEDTHGEEAHDHGDHEEDTHGEEVHHDDDKTSADTDAVEIEGMSKHYHSGEAVQLTAIPSEELTHGHWSWHTLEPGDEEWKTISDQQTNKYEGKATSHGQQIKAAFLDDDHNTVAESEVVTILIDDHDGDYDPHIWIDPLRMMEASEIIKEELIALNPEQEALYTQNFDELKKELMALDERYIELLETKENKHIIVPHAAFGYWEERYGVRQIAVSGLSSSDEPSQKDLTQVVKKAKEYDLSYILYEQNSTNRLSEIIQEQIGAETLIIHNITVLTEEDLANKEDYISLMNYNLEILDKATK
ncbi:zinc ABC transporter substrate-binding protein [Virgibacillus sp. C22-A2]|uniref:Zinc ABC transporter substrate-binding protein n=1 Tax=Virgibacillus tibetensis TaxID=3042313 RepID=A0ABU6KHN7_9BACI|nr:zinc ABC transporter substrate-binding protein [Virgibacillus sp. C22-A2]